MKIFRPSLFFYPKYKKYNLISFKKSKIILPSSRKTHKMVPPPKIEPKFKNKIPLPENLPTVI